jgi:hypothetical protein
LPTTKLWTAGDVLTAADIMAFANAGKAWTAYTPGWTSTGTAPAIGNGTLTGRYLQLGALVIFSAEMVAGTTTTFGTGNYSLQLPVTGRAGTPAIFCSGVARDDSTTNRYLINAGIGGTMQVYAGAGTGAMVGLTGTVPFTFANLDSINLFGAYEAA